MTDQPLARGEIVARAPDFRVFASDRQLPNARFGGASGCWSSIFLGRIDVHGGYFDGAVANRLIYRLACLGFQRAAKAYGNEKQLLSECAAAQIRVLLSRRLEPRRQRSRECMSVSLK